MNSLNKENYLKALFHLADSSNEIYIKDISNHLNIRMPSVNSMMKKFASKNWVIYNSYKPIILTDEGRKVAALVVRKHRLIEMFLVQNLGFTWDQVHEIAEELEHVQSKIFFDRIDELLGYPKSDPHGSFIPDREGNVKKNDYKKLSECEDGEIVKFSSVGESTDDFLRFLDNKKLNLGTTIEIIETEPFDGSKKVKYNSHEEIFSKVVLDRILVSKS